MSVTVEPLEGSPRLLAHDGAAAHAEPGSPDAFRLALRIGADGLYSRAWSTEGGEVSVGRPPRRFRRGGTTTSIDEVVDLLEGTGATLALAVEDAATAATALRSARLAGTVERLWLCATDVGLLTELRQESPAARFLHIADPGSVHQGPERHAAFLRRSGVHGMAVAEDGTTAGFVTLMHRFGRIVVAMGADHERTARRAIGNGVDAVAGVDVEVLRAARDRHPS